MQSRFAVIRNALVEKGIIDDIFLRNRNVQGLEEEKLLSSAYSKSDLVYICIKTTAQAISQIPLLLGQTNAEGLWEAIASDHPWQLRLKRPNMLLDEYSFIEAIVSYLMLDGDVWIVPYLPELSERKVPASLWVVNKKNMSAVKNKQTGQLEAWSYKPNEGTSIVLPIEVVSRVFFWNPYNPMSGFSPITAGKISVTTDYKAAIYNQVFFDNGATISGTMETEQKLGDKQYERLKSLIKKKTGYRKSWEPLVLEAGLKYNQTAPSHKDMTFTELRKLDKERILQIFGMKKSIISITDDLNRATADEQAKSWWQNTNIPIMRLIQSAFNFTFFERYGYEVRFDISSIEALQRDFAEKVETGEKLFNIGFTPNEINEKLQLGFDEKPFRDYIWKTISLVPVGEDIPVTAPITEEPEEVLLPLEEEMIYLPEPNKGQLSEVIDFKSEVIDFKIASVKDVSDQNWKSIVSTVAPIEKAFKNKVNKAFFNYRKAVLEWLYKQKKTAKGDDSPFLLTRPLKELEEIGLRSVKQLKKEAQALYEMTMMAGLETLALELGVAIDVDLLGTPEAIEFLKQKIIRLVGEDGIQRTISNQLNKTIIQGIENKESIEQIANRIKGKFNSATSRAKTIARTETYGALNRGRNIAGKEVPFKRWKWFTALDEKVRTTHKKMHGKTRAKNKPWIVGGSKLRYPGDYMGASGEVINCRCIEVPDMTSI